MIKKMIVALSAVVRIALGVAAIAAIYNVLKNRRKGCRWDGPHGPHQA